MKSFDLKVLALDILNDHPQVIAYTLALLDEKIAGDILKEIPEYLLMDIIYRISSLQEIKPAVAEKILNDLGKKITIPPLEDIGPIDGLKKAARLLDLAEPYIMTNVLTAIDEVDQDRANEIRKRLKT